MFFGGWVKCSRCFTQMEKSFLLPLAFGGGIKHTPLQYLLSPSIPTLSSLKMLKHIVAKRITVRQKKQNAVVQSERPLNTAWLLSLVEPVKNILMLILP